MVLRPASWNKVIESNVPRTRARSCGGQNFLIPEGVNHRIATVINASANSIGWIPAIRVGRLVSVPITPPEASWPRKAGNCRITRIAPMPDMKPEITV